MQKEARIIREHTGLPRVSPGESPYREGDVNVVSDPRVGIVGVRRKQPGVWMLMHQDCFLEKPRKMIEATLRRGFLRHDFQVFKSSSRSKGHSSRELNPELFIVDGLHVTAD